MCCTVVTGQSIKQMLFLDKRRINKNQIGILSNFFESWCYINQIRFMLNITENLLILPFFPSWVNNTFYGSRHLRTYMYLFDMKVPYDCYDYILLRTGYYVFIRYRWTPHLSSKSQIIGRFRDPWPEMQMVSD